MAFIVRHFPTAHWCCCTWTLVGINDVTHPPPHGQRFNWNNSRSKFSWSWEDASKPTVSRATQNRNGPSQILCSAQLAVQPCLWFQFGGALDFAFQFTCTQSRESIQIISNLSGVDKWHYDVELPLILALSLLVRSAAFFLILWRQGDMLFYSN